MKSSGRLLDPRNSRKNVLKLWLLLEAVVAHVDERLKLGDSTQPSLTHGGPGYFHSASGEALLIGRWKSWEG
jgi:hypothetical protein